MHVYKTEDYLNPNETIYITKTSDSCSEPIHTHDFIEIVYILSGKMTHMIDGQQYEVRSGDILFMNYGCTHSFSATAEYSYINLLFSPEHIGEDLLSSPNAFILLSFSVFNDICREINYGKSTFWGSEKKEIEDILFSMLNEYQYKKTMYMVLVHSLSKMLL